MTPVTTTLVPVFALALWTFCMVCLIAVTRIGAALSGKITPEDFRFGESSRVPSHVALANRNYMNLLEMPLLFYVISLILVTMPQAIDSLTLGLQWAFVAIRVVHSLIHVTYNNVLHRLAAFALGNGVVLVLWITVAVRLLHGNAA